MKSPAHSRDNTRGFTLLEILVVLALLGFIATMGIGIGIDTYRSQIFDSQLATVTSFLQTARNRAMNNVLQSEHGVRIEDDIIVLYVEGGEEYAVPRNDTVAITGDDDVLFEQLSGETAGDLSITLDNGARDPITITIDDNGRIDW